MRRRVHYATARLSGRACVLPRGEGGWRRLEDRDEPITAEHDVELEIAEAKGAVDPQDEDPEPVARWLAEQGVAV